MCRPATPGQEAQDDAKAQRLWQKLPRWQIWKIKFLREIDSRVFAIFVASETASLNTELNLVYDAPSSSSGQPGAREVTSQ